MLSDLIVTEVSGSHVLTIHGYSHCKGVVHGDFITAGTFAAAGHDWSILYYPSGDFNIQTDWISLYLKLHRPTMTTHGAAAADAVKARFTFSLLGVDGQPLQGYTKASDDGACDKVFAPMTTKQGFPKFIRRSALPLVSRTNVFDNFSVRCDITSQGAAAARFVVVPPSSMGQDLGRLRASGKGADVAFEVAGETFAAHRKILTTRSPVFMAEFFGPMKEMAVNSCCSVRIEDMEATVFKALLHFVYTDSLPEIDEGVEAMVMSQHLLVAADRYGLERLKLICEDSLCNYIDTGSVGTILTLAEQHGCQGLKKACFQFLMSANSLKAAIETDGFDHLTNSCPSVLKELLSKVTIV
ncbi:hypothetical protein BS78_05G217900 [Paspalum vaginatum]|nr:hypothetical protein BS78_05G217900 [Paspalum vaginatum]